jgi:hypothetical protein
MKHHKTVMVQPWQRLYYGFFEKTKKLLKLSLVEKGSQVDSLYPVE